MSETSEQNRLKQLATLQLADKLAQPVSSGAPSLYVGIGASTGELAVLQTFFERIRGDSGAVFLVVLYFSPDCDSRVDELLASHTSMSVQFASQGMNVVANAVYIIPPNSNLRIEGGILYLDDQIRDGTPNLPIDIFFHSLAEDVRHRSVGVILSGAGSDGSRGIKRIKESGGLVLVQSCDSAELSSMSYVAALTWAADLILPLVELANHLSMYLSCSMVKTTAMLSLPRVDPDDPALCELFKILISNCGTDFSRYESKLVRQRIGRRMDIHQSKLLSDYIQVLKPSVSEQTVLIRDLLIPISTFFDNQLLWNHLSSEILPSLLKAADTQQGLRFWVVGCATGEEAYTLAMVMDETMHRYGQSVPIKIFATDIDSNSLDVAIAGIYGREIAPDMSKDRLSRYFVTVDDKYEVRPDIRRSVRFSNHDIVNDAPYPSIDFILCRKVLPYLKTKAQSDALSAIIQSLNDYASIIIGPSESAADLETHFQCVHATLGHYTKAQSPDIKTTESTSDDPIADHLIQTISKTHRVDKGSGINRYEFVKDHLIQRHISACIILDSQEQIVQLYNGAADYLSQPVEQRGSLSIHTLIALELKDVLSSAMRRAKTTSEQIQCSHIRFHLTDRSTHVTLIVQCFNARPQDDTYYSVVILDEKNGTSLEKERPINLSEQTRQPVSMLEDRLLHGDEQLNLVNQALKGHSEQSQIFSKELTTANDELQDVNEQLRLVNTQLRTINTIHEETIEELTANAVESEFVLNAISVGFVVLDNNLAICNYTAESKKYFRLVPDDVGKFLTDITHLLDYDDLADDVNTTHNTHQGCSRTVQTKKGQWVKVDILPYYSKRPEASLSSAIAIRMIPVKNLPAIAASAISGRSICPRSPQKVQQKITLLLIAVCAVDRHRVVNYLSKITSININIFEADDVNSALNSLTENSFDVCLCDYSLSHDTANNLAKSISDINDTVPVILMSGSIRKQFTGKIPASLLEYALDKDDLSSLLLELSIRHAIGIYE